MRQNKKGKTMKNGHRSFELTEKELASHRPQGTMVAVRIFKSPYHWYAGKLSDIWIEKDGSCSLALEQQVHFERTKNAGRDTGPDVLGNTLVDNMADRPAPGAHAVPIPQFILTKPRRVEDPHEGVLHIACEGGSAFLSIRGQDVIAVTQLLERSANQAHQKSHA